MRESRDNIWLVIRAKTSSDRLYCWIDKALINKKQIIVTGHRGQTSFQQEETTTEALLFAKDKGADRVLQADIKIHHPDDLNIFLEKTDQSKGNLIVASRHLEKEKAKGVFALVSRAENCLISYILKKQIKDFTSTLRVWDKKAIESLKRGKSPPEHLLALESIFFISGQNLKIKEIPFSRLKTQKIGPIFFAETILYALLLKLGRPRTQALEFFRFLIIGSTGYLLNLAIFSLLVIFSINPLVSAFFSFLFSASYSFLGNKTWTFRSSGGRSKEFIKFLIISSSALMVNLVILEILLNFLAKVPSQAIAIACVTPVNFLGHKLWTFKENQQLKKLRK